MTAVQWFSTTVAVFCGGMGLYMLYRAWGAWQEGLGYGLVPMGLAFAILDFGLAALNAHLAGWL